MAEASSVIAGAHLLVRHVNASACKGPSCHASVYSTEVQRRPVLRGGHSLRTAGVAGTDDLGDGVVPAVRMRRARSQTALARRLQKHDVQQYDLRNSEPTSRIRRAPAHPTPHRAVAFRHRGNERSSSLSRRQRGTGQSPVLHLSSRGFVRARRCAAWRTRCVGQRN